MFQQHELGIALTGLINNCVSLGVWLFQSGSSGTVSNTSMSYVVPTGDSSMPLPLSVQYKGVPCYTLLLHSTSQLELTSIYGFHLSSSEPQLDDIRTSVKVWTA